MLGILDRNQKEKIINKINGSPMPSVLKNDINMNNFDKNVWNKTDRAPKSQ